MYKSSLKIKIQVNFLKPAKFWFKNYTSDKKFKKRIAFMVISLIVFGIFGLETLYASKVQATQGILHKTDIQENPVHSSGINISALSQTRERG